MDQVSIGIVFFGEVDEANKDQIKKLIELICTSDKEEPSPPKFIYKFYNETTPEFIDIFKESVNTVYKKNPDGVATIQSLDNVPSDSSVFIKSISGLYTFSDDEKTKEIINLFKEKKPENKRVEMDITTLSGINSAINYWNQSLNLNYSIFKK